MNEDDRRFEKLLGALIRLCEAIETQNELTAMQIDGLSPSGSEEDDGLNVPQSL